MAVASNESERNKKMAHTPIFLDVVINVTLPLARPAHSVTRVAMLYVVDRNVGVLYVVDRNVGVLLGVQCTVHFSVSFRHVVCLQM